MRRLVVVALLALVVTGASSCGGGESKAEITKRCRSYAIEGRDDLMPLCWKELREAQ